MNNKTSRKIFLIDNFDSFTYNLVNQLKSMVDDLDVYRNDISFEKICEIIDASKSEKLIVLSPGPGSPNKAGNVLDLIHYYQGVLPILGICLGYQAIVQSFGGRIGAANSIIHGKAEAIELSNDQSEIFGNLQSPFIAARYHSLAAKKIPDMLTVIAKTENEIMAVKHKYHRILGYQFHPESILTPRGGELLHNSLHWLFQHPESK